MAISPDRHRIAGEYLDRARKLTADAAAILATAQADVDRAAQSAAHLVSLARAYGWTDKQIRRRLGISRREFRGLLLLVTAARDGQR